MDSSKIKSLKMKEYKIEKVSKDSLVAVVCDCCGTKSKNSMDYVEWLNWEDVCGYGNKYFGDGNLVSLDLCQVCTFELLGKYVKVTERELF
jgi:hypothetical protein